jgi:hypothetical protein
VLNLLPASFQSCNPITLKGDLKTCCCSSCVAGQQLMSILYYCSLLDDVSGNGISSVFTDLGFAGTKQMLSPKFLTLNHHTDWSDRRGHFFIGGLNQIKTTELPTHARCGVSIKLINKQLSRSRFISQLLQRLQPDAHAISDSPFQTSRLKNLLRPGAAAIPRRQATRGSIRESRACMADTDL